MKQHGLAVFSMWFHDSRLNVSVFPTNHRFDTFASRSHEMPTFANHLFCAATRTTVKPIFTMACITNSWNNSAARVPYNAFFNCHTTPCCVFLSSRGIDPNVLVQQCMVECHPHVVETTPSASLTAAQRGCETQHQSYATQYRSPREAIRSCLPCYLHGYRSVSHRDRSIQASLVVIQPLDPNSLPDCVVPRHSLTHSRTFVSSHVLSRDLHARAVDPAARHCDVRRLLHWEALHSPTWPSLSSSDGQRCYPGHFFDIHIKRSHVSKLSRVDLSLGSAR